MEDIFDDESTDDEFGVNLQLAERLRINRCDHNSQEAMFENSKEFKQYCNMRRKEQCARAGGESSSSSFEIYNDGSIPETPSPYLLPNKKRQNGDKSEENFANPKRTCLSDRFQRTSEWRENKKKGGHAEGQYSCKISESKFSYPERHMSERDLSPDKTYESHLSNGANLHESDDSDSEVDHAFSKRNFRNRAGSKTRTFRNNLSLPSSSTSGVCTNPYESRSSSSRGVQFIESDSDESTKSAAQNGALKGGRQSPDYVYYNKKVVGRRNKKVLDSDDTEDDSWQVGYRSKPICFSSSDSEDSRETNKKNHTDTISKATADHSFPYSEESCILNDKRHVISLQTFKPSSFGGDSANSQKISTSGSRCQFHPQSLHSRTLERSRRAHQTSRNGLTSPNFPSSEIKFSSSITHPSSPLRGRSRMMRGERHSRRAGSPHPRLMRSQCRTDTRSAAGRLANPSHAENGTLDLMATYPDLFDAEDSSEVEFFTANSYSDSETSNESLGGLTINTAFVSHPDARSNKEIECKHSVNVGSSEDEISVVFSTAPHSRNSEQRRGSSRAIGRRYSRGPARSHLQNAQEAVSLSPDPVEQVRQMEEDERFARMLQAQFDAEVDPDFTPSSLNSTIAVPPSSADSDDEIIDPVGESDSDRFTPPLIPGLPRPPSIRRGHRIGHYNGRTRVPSFSPGIVLFNNRRSRNRSRNRRRLASLPTDPWMWQFARILGLGTHIASSMSSMSSIDSMENDYEALIDLADANGEAVQRGLQRTQINRLPTRKYINPNSANSSSYGSEVTHKRTELNKECQVCLSDYESGDVLRILPCFHEFHTPCIDPWLKINHTCPVCRVIVDLGE